MVFTPVSTFPIRKVKRGVRKIGGKELVGTARIKYLYLYYPSTVFLN